MSWVTHEEPNFKVVVHPLRSTPINVGTVEYQFRPDEMHIIPDGALQDKPCVLFVLTDAQGRRFVAQLSERMIRHGIKALDEIVQEEPKADERANTGTLPLL